MEKRGRELSAQEAHAVITETATKKYLVSWFDPFLDRMIDAIKTKKNHIYMDGKPFTIKKCANGKDYVFMHMWGFNPMTRVSLENLEDRHGLSVIK